jgi:hypothetical protein
MLIILATIERNGMNVLIAVALLLTTHTLFPAATTAVAATTAAAVPSAPVVTKEMVLAAKKEQTKKKLPRKIFNIYLHSAVGKVLSPELQNIIASYRGAEDPWSIQDVLALGYKPKITPYAELDVSRLGLETCCFGVNCRKTGLWNICTTQPITAINLSSNELTDVVCRGIKRAPFLQQLDLSFNKIARPETLRIAVISLRNRARLQWLRIDTYSQKVPDLDQQAAERWWKQP